MLRGSVKGTGYPINSPVSPSLSLPCVTVCHHISTRLYWLPTPFASFSFNSPPMRHRVPSHFNWTLPLRQMLCVAPTHVNTNFSFVSQKCAFSQISGFTQISWQAFSTNCCNTCTSTSLIGSEYTNVFKCVLSHNGLRSIDRAGQCTGSSRPINCLPTVSGSRCPTKCRKCGGVWTYTCCHWWEGTCTGSAGKSLNENWLQTAPVYSVKHKGKVTPLQARCGPEAG
jgi:hypothetical protein